MTNSGLTDQLRQETFRRRRALWAHPGRNAAWVKSNCLLLRPHCVAVCQRAPHLRCRSHLFRQTTPQAWSRYVGSAALMDVVGGDPITIVATAPTRITRATAIGVTTTATIITSSCFDARCGLHLASKGTFMCHWDSRQSPAAVSSGQHGKS